MSFSTHIQPSGVVAHAVAAIRDAFAVFGASVRSAGAVEMHTAPAARDLRILGIDPKSFPKV